MMLLDFLMLLNDHCGAAYRYHQHAFANNLVIDVHPDDGICAHAGGVLRHLCECGVSGFLELGLIYAGASSYKVRDGRHKVSYYVRSHNNLACRDAQILLNWITLSRLLHQR